MMLEVSDLHTYYGDSYVLQGVSLALDAGRTIAILGRNGAGKSTFIYSIMGFVRARRGTILFKGNDITALPSHRIAACGIALVPQGRRIFPSLTVREHLALASRPGDWRLERVLEMFPRLRERWHNRAGTLSGGEQQMLAIGRALVANPALVLMDEPSEGLSPLFVQETARIVRELNAAGIAVLLVEQNVGFALAVAESVLIMNKGTIVHTSDPETLRRSDAIRSQYLGL